MITYPVSPESRWAIYRLSSAAVVAKNKFWPRDDGMEVEKLDPDFVLLLHVQTAPPAFNPATHKVERAASLVDVTENTLTQAWSIVPLTAGELADIAAQATRTTDSTQIKAALTALKNGTGTQADRLARCEKALAYLIRDFIA
jgi:hypothetical protein